MRKMKKYGFFYLAAILFCAFVLLSLRSSRSLLPLFANSNAINPLSKATPTPTLLPFPTTSPSATPTPTLAPTPTPKPLGYCLSIPVLLYHHIQPADVASKKGQSSLNVDNSIFDQQMAYLKQKGYSFVTVGQIADALRTKSTLPEKSIAITIDDGYKDLYDNAFPIFKKYGIVANLMIPTGLLGGADYISWPQLEEMVHSGMFVSNHTWSHYALARGPHDKVVFEIDTAKNQLAEHGMSSNVFTYPYGSFNNEVITVLEQKGYVAAFSTLPGTLQCDSFIMALHRTRIGNASLSYYGF